MGSVEASAADAAAGRGDAPAADAAAGRGDLDEGVFDPVEHAAVVLGLLGSARCGVQLLVERLLVLRQRAGDHDVEINELIAAPRGAEVRDALALEPDGLPVLGPGRHADAGALTVDGRHLELVAER